LTPGVDNEIRRQHELGSITRKPLLPNAMILVGLIMIFGVSATLFGTFWNWTLAGLGFALFGVGYYLKRRHINQRRDQTAGMDSEA
jgi:membrane protein implicated in regulation of membrane protease activity